MEQTPNDLIASERIGLAYSGFRHGQHPDRGQGAVWPTTAEIEEDLNLLHAYGVRLIRLYDGQRNSVEVLQAIERLKLPMKVVLGAWLNAELSAHETCAWLAEPIPAEQLEKNRIANEAEVDRIIALARAHPQTVAAVNVGNETLVTWNDHLVPIDRLVGYLQKVKRSIAQSVTTADNYLAWVEHGERLRPVTDFAFVHAYPVWEGKALAEADAFTRQNLLQVKEALPGFPLAVGEAGWPTVASEFGDRANEQNQEKYLTDLFNLSVQGITVIVFEAFDEDWKGDDNPDGAEKHWGLFNIDRSPKAAAGRLRDMLKAQ